MAVYFLESSALVKNYIDETGSQWIRGLINPAAGNESYVVRTTEIEITSAVVRRQLSGSLTAAQAASALVSFRHDLGYEFQVLEVEVALVTSAVRLVEAYGLRAYDALQLAAAIHANNFRSALAIPPLTLVSADQELNAAAATVGLPLEDPNQHP